MGKWKEKLLCLALICLCLTGCIPDEFEKEDAKEQEKEAVEIFNRYLDEELGGGEIESVSVHRETAGGPAYHMTDFVDGEFIYGEKTYSFVVNTRTEEIYTSLKMDELKEKGTEYVLDSLDISCDKIVEKRFYIELYVPALEDDTENIYEGKDIGLRNVLPAAFEVREQDLEALFNDENCDIKIYITYEGERWDGNGANELPALKVLELEPVRERSELAED